MTHVRLVAWNEEEAEARAAALRRAGFAVTCFTDSRAAPLALLDVLPDVFVIDLGRAPAQGRELGGWLRRRKATRWIPIVFVEGDPEKTQRVRDLLPDAVFTTWDAIEEALAATLENPPADPVVPGTMDAYAGVPLAKKLGIRAGTSLALIGAPEEFAAAVGPLPKSVDLVTSKMRSVDTVCLFARDVAALGRTFSEAIERLAEGGRLWIAWPKKSSGVSSDLSESAVREYGLSRGLVDYKIAAIDPVWSGLCFARRNVD